jgi:hypothetical protein
MHPTHQIARVVSVRRRLMRSGHNATPEGTDPRECMHTTHAVSHGHAAT